MASKDLLSATECAILTQALQLKRESLVRAQRKEITGSEMYAVIGRQISEIDVLGSKVYQLSS